MNATDSRERAQAEVDRLGLGVAAEFVPYSRSRNYKEGAKVGEMSLNWKVALLRNGREVLTTDYSAGIGHCPSYKQRSLSVDDAEAIRRECETGHRALPIVVSAAKSMGMPIEPDPLDVLYSLVSDASVLDSSGFEDWAADFGYDTDSRKAEATYRACLEIALKLRNGIGEESLAQLREAFQDF